MWLVSSFFLVCWLSGEVQAKKRKFWSSGFFLCMSSCVGFEVFNRLVPDGGDLTAFLYGVWDRTDRKEKKGTDG